MQTIPTDAGERAGQARLVAAVAIAAAMIVIGMLSLRPLRSPDLGYHLAYGETFLDEGRIVDHNAFLFTLPAEGDEQPEPGPSCWYDAEGRYRFVNANWLSQVIMAAFWRLEGASGLCGLQSVLILATFALIGLAMRRLGVPPALIGAGLLLAALTAYMRFSLRPETFGYLLLAAQFCLLAGRKFGWLAVAGLAGLQVLFVNLHSYFILGLALTGAMLAESLLRLGWQWLTASGRQGSPELRRRAVRLAVALAAQCALCLVNPWTWRLAVLPVQTLVYMRANQIARGDLTGDGHPWSHIGEFFRPLAGVFLDTTATWAFCGVLALSAMGAIAAAAKRRWAWLAVIVAMAAVSMSMRRNIAPAALLLVPLALAACCGAVGPIWTRLHAKTRRWLIAVVPIAAILSAGWLGFSIATQRFYFAERSPARFGVGLSKLELPLDAANIVYAQRNERLWTDYSGSSNFYYFAYKPAVPILTNTWAYPPDVMRMVLDVASGVRPFEQTERKFGLQTVALRMDRTTAPLARHLAGRDDWSLAHLDARFVVFHKGSDAGISERALDANRHIEQLKALDPVPAFALHLGGMTLYRLGWDIPAAKIFAAAVAEHPAYHEAWNMQGVCLARRGEKLRAMTGSTELLKQAEVCFRRALELRGDYATARTNLDRVLRQLQ